MPTPDEDWKRLKAMKAEDVKKELDENGVPYRDAVSHVLSMVREAKRKQKLYHAEKN